jgi:hypothetical protein
VGKWEGGAVQVDHNSQDRDPNRQNLMCEERTQLTLATDREIRVPVRNGEAGTSTTERLRMRPFRQRRAGKARQGTGPLRDPQEQRWGTNT